MTKLTIVLGGPVLCFVDAALLHWLVGDAALGQKWVLGLSTLGLSALFFYVAMYVHWRFTGHPSTNTDDDSLKEATTLALMAIRHDGYVEGVCLADAPDAQQWTSDMKRSGHTVKTCAQDIAKRHVFDYLPADIEVGLP